MSLRGDATGCRRGAGRPDAQTRRGRTHVDRENRIKPVVCDRIYAQPDRVSIDLHREKKYFFQKRI